MQERLPILGCHQLVDVRFIDMYSGGTSIEQRRMCMKYTAE